MPDALLAGFGVSIMILGGFGLLIGVWKAFGSLEVNRQEHAARTDEY